MKTMYTSPELEIVKFDAMERLAASDNSLSGGKDDIYDEEDNVETIGF